jgi:hypothetical protein
MGIVGVVLENVKRMTQEEFKRELDQKGIFYEMEGERLVIVCYSDLNLNRIKAIPSGVIFRHWNSGVHPKVYLNGLEEIPSGVEFGGGRIYLNSLRRIDPSIKIGGNCVMICPMLGTENGLCVPAIYSFMFGIDGIEDWRILNKMISSGLFDRRL